MRDRPLLYLCLVIAAAVMLSVLCGGERFVRELRPSALESSVPEGDLAAVIGRVYRIEQKENCQALYLEKNFVKYRKKTEREQSCREGSVQGEAYQEQSVREEANQEEAYREQSVREEANQEEAYQEQSVREEAYQEESFQESRIIIYTDSEIQFQIGNRVEAKGEVSFFQGARNPGNFDQKRYYQILDIHGTIWAEDICIVDTGIQKWKARLENFRKRWMEILLSNFGKEDGGVMGAVMLGEKSEVDQELKTLYQVNGIGHIIAISGLHLSFIGIGMYKLLRRITGSYPVGGIFGILFLMLYILMIGFTVSAVRALVMFLFRVGADMAGRHYDAPTALSAAAVVVLVWRPLSLYDGGFWLSFGAVLAILAVVPVVQEGISMCVLHNNGQKMKVKMKMKTKTKAIVQEDISVYASCTTNVLHSGSVQVPDNRKEETQSCLRKNRKGETQSSPGQNREDGFLSGYLMGVWGHVWQVIIQGLTASAGINLVILPILLYYFFEFPLYSFILNLFVIPLMSVLLFLGMAGSLSALWFAPVSALLFWICSKILWIYKMSCEITLGLPGARLVIGRPDLWQIAVYYGILFLGLIWLRYIILSVKMQEEQKEREDPADQRNRRNQRKQREAQSGSFNGNVASIGQIEFFRDSKNRKKKQIAVFSLWALGIMILMTRFGEAGKLTTVVLDVGQGDGIFMRGPEGNTYLVDGGSSDVKKVGQYRLEPFLKSQGVGRLDYVLISHGDSDHMNGVDELIGRQEISVKIGTLVLPVKEVWDEALTGLARKARKQGIRVVMIKPGQSIREGDMVITCIQPGNMEIKSENAESRRESAVPGTGNEGLESGNEASMVLAVQYGPFDLLLTGDVEGEGENQLTKQLEERYPDCTWDILKVAHHGSKNSSTEEFLRLVRPAYALISAGQENRYGHPHQETIERLADVGSKIYSTQENGAIIVEVENGEILRMERWKR